jgi:prepilin-type N-terminal cleavage/methylation domain-containing protein
MAEAGFTLIELLLGIAIMGIIVGSIYEITGKTVAIYATANERQDLVLRARYALERMVMFVQESDEIAKPDTADPVESLKVSERISNQYVNTTHAYNAAGDLFFDADNDANGLVNDVSQDPPDYVSFEIDKTDPANWKLVERMPDYSTADTSDFKAGKIICEHITAVDDNHPAFSAKRLLSPSGAVSGRVEITLTLRQGSTAVTLKTTAKARWMD